MPKPFDATLKDMAGLDPAGFLAGIDAPPTLPVRLLNVDLSTVTAAADLVFGLGDPLQEVIHLDAQAGPDPDKHRDLLAYNALLHRQYRVPVHSIFLLLRREALLHAQTGSIAYAPRPAGVKWTSGTRCCAYGSGPSRPCWTAAWPLYPWRRCAACRKACPWKTGCAGW